MHSDQVDIRVIDGLYSIERASERVDIEKFVSSFREQTNSEPEFVIRSPGRINLIGDHIDYHGFSVLPMAIDNSILLGLSLNNCHGPAGERQLRISNKDSHLYEPFRGRHSFSYGCRLNKSHRWHHYVLCGYHGVLVSQLLKVDACQLVKHLACQSPDSQDDRILSETLVHDLNLFIDSNLPPASGLSSSSALVCASAIATRLFLLANNIHESGWPKRPIKIDSKSMAADCAKFERLVGTHGGGMDQAVIITAQDKYAKHVEFMPEFRCTNVRLPDDVVWLVSHCGSNYPKAATSGFNSRVLETKLGAAMILKALRSGGLGDSIHDVLDHTLTLGQVRNEVFPAAPMEEICTILRNQVFQGAEELGIDEICSRLSMSRADLIAKFNTSEEFLVENGLDKRVKLLQRCLHVFQEAERVEQFKLICDTTKDASQLGRLMSESHFSLRDQYECSHPDLDRLVETALEAGALGARLTGAGWGGCIVSLVEASRFPRVQAELEKVSKFTFRTEPRAGCTIIKVRD